MCHWNNYQKENKPERITILGKLLRWIILKFVCLFVFVSVINAGQFPRNYSGLAGLYHFNGISNNVTTDYYYINSNNDIDTYVVGGTNTKPLLSDGKFGKGYMFFYDTGQSNRHINIYTSTCVPESITGNNSRTVMFWLNLYDYIAPAGGSGAICGYGNRVNEVNAPGGAWVILVGDGNTDNRQYYLSIYLGNGILIDPGTIHGGEGMWVRLNQWQHFAISYNSNKTLKFYKNGILQKQMTLANTLNTSKNDLQIGEIYDTGGGNYVMKHDGGAQYKEAVKGVIDELIFLNYAPSDNEIKKIYQEQVGNYNQGEQ